MVLSKIVKDDAGFFLTQFIHELTEKKTQWIPPDELRKHGGL